MSELVLKPHGEVTFFETDLNGNEIKGTREKFNNTIGTDLKRYLAQSIAAIVNEAIDNPFAASPAVTLAGDGIALYNLGLLSLTHSFNTSRNTGGTGAESYVEFYGYINGAVTLVGELQLGFNATAAPVFTSIFATYTINKTVAADRRFHFYWKITIG